MERYIKKFDEQAREAMGFAKEEAKRAGSEYLGTEHIFLGILMVGGVGFQAIKNFDIDIDKLTERVRDIMTKDEFDERKELVGMTPRVEKLLNLAEKYSLELNQDFIGTGHLLYGSLAEKYGFAEVLLIDNNRTKEAIRKELTSLLTTGKSSLPSIILNANGRPYARV